MTLKSLSRLSRLHLGLLAMLVGVLLVGPMFVAEGSDSFDTGESGGKLYAGIWGNRGTIRRANLDGSEVETIVVGDYPYFMALDTSSAKLYWTRGPGSGNEIKRSNLDGSDVEVFQRCDPDVEYYECVGIAIDVNKGQVYWIEATYILREAGRIKRANVDGSGLETILAAPGIFPSDIELDLAQGKMYWTQLSGEYPDEVGEIVRANLDGSEVQVLVTDLSFDNAPYDLALDLAAGKMYWTDFTGIWRADLDGSRVELVLSDDEPGSIALDAFGGKVYWSTCGMNPNEIRRADLDGSNIEDLATGNFCAYGLVLDLWTRRSFMARLRGADEVPPVDTGARGLAGLRVEASEAALKWGIALREIEAMTAVHIHCATKGENGPIGLTLLDGGPISIARTRVFTGVARRPDPGNACGWSDLADIAEAISGGETYLNVHTIANPAGEIRGQLREIDVLPSEVDS